jgi:hypothetical protein
LCMDFMVLTSQKKEDAWLRGLYCTTVEHTA